MANLPSEISACGAIPIEFPKYLALAITKLSTLPSQENSLALTFINFFL